MLPPSQFHIAAVALLGLSCLAIVSRAIEAKGDKLRNQVLEAMVRKSELLRLQQKQDEGDDDDDKVQSTPGNPYKTYGVIVDCGSSGTRAHLYEWDTDKSYPELLHDIEPMRDDLDKPITKKITPGLSSLAEDPSKASEYIQPIMDFITSQIPSYRLSYTGVYILATAGMRLLDEKTQHHIMRDIARHLKNHYNFAHVTTSVISGAAEGMYQWISVNAKAKRFLEGNTNPKTPTFGVIEMGGASIQVTYQLRPGMRNMLNSWLGNSPAALEAVNSQIVEPQISRAEEQHNFKLVSVTFLGFGGNSAYEAYVDSLVKTDKPWRLKLADKIMSTHYTRLDKHKTLTVFDPCMPKGAQDSMLKPISMLNAQSQTVGFKTEEDEPTFTVELRGSGNYGECRSRVKNMLQRAKSERMNCKPDEPCTMSLLGEHFVPWHRFSFLGLSDFYHTTNSMLELSGHYDHEKIIRKSRKICSMSYKDILRKFPDVNKFDDTRGRRECFKAAFVDTFLTDGLGMPYSFSDFETVNKIRGDDPEWTLGAVLDKSLSLEKATSSGERSWLRLQNRVLEASEEERKKILEKVAGSDIEVEEYSEESEPEIV